MTLKEIIAKLLPKRKPLCNPDILDEARRYATGARFTLNIVADTLYSLKEAKEKAHKEGVRIPRRMISEIEEQAYEFAVKDALKRAHHAIHLGEYQIAVQYAEMAENVAYYSGMNINEDIYDLERILGVRLS